MAKTVACPIMYHSAQYPDPFVLLPKSGYVYLKSDRADLGYYILRSSSDICFMLEKSRTRESRFFCIQYAGMTVLNIDLREGSFLASQQLDVHGKKMWAALVKLQRWFRQFQHKYRVPRRTALAMCLHERLGDGACLSSIGADVLELVALIAFG